MFSYFDQIFSKYQNASSQGFSTLAYLVTDFSRVFDFLFNQLIISRLNTYGGFSLDSSGLMQHFSNLFYTIFSALQDLIAPTL